MYKDEKKGIVHRFKLKLLLVLAALGILPGVASAANETFNFTTVIEMIDSIIPIFPSIIALILAVLPILVAIAVISLLLGIIYAVLDGVKNMFGRMW